jgi:hypothetical protein
MSTNNYPARIFALIPEASNDAVIIRRGPAEKVGVFQWNIKTDRIEEYQWLLGRIYEYFSDISPDGNCLIYSAIKKGWGYTVISHSPWLKAISFWRNVGGYGGGIFVDNKHYMLYDGSDSYGEFISSELSRIQRDHELLNYGVYHARLLKRDWQVKSYDEHGITFFKRIDKKTILEKLWKKWPFGANKKGKGSFWEYHRLIRGTTSLDKDKWEWCELLNGDIVWVEEGCLYRSKNIQDDLTIDSQLVYDFNQMAFKEKVAPY